jgi:exodeoxyribonuclease VII small subunit
MQHVVRKKEHAVKKQSRAEEIAFEAAFAQLEEIVGKLEAGDLPLDEALALFEQGQKLAALCSAKLDEAELKVQQLSASGAVEPFDAEEAR